MQKKVETLKEKVKIKLIKILESRTHAISSLHYLPWQNQG